MARKPGKAQALLLAELCQRDVPHVRHENHRITRAHHTINIRWTWAGADRDWRDSTVHAVVRSGWAEYVTGVECGARRKSRSLRITEDGRATSQAVK